MSKNRLWHLHNTGMPIKRRYLIPNLPHHVTQRGTRRERIFFNDKDYRLYLRLLCEWSEREAVEIWSYCLMPNHVHLILVPGTESNMSKMIGQTHRLYAKYINERNDWTGNLWQERFYSSVLDESHLLNAVRYVEQNPVRAGLVRSPEDWRWSSAPAHIYGRWDGIVNLEAMNTYIRNWQEYLGSNLAESQINKIRANTLKCLPTAEDSFVKNLENKFNIKLRRPLRGRPRRDPSN